MNTIQILSLVGIAVVAAASMLPRLFAARTSPDDVQTKLSPVSPGISTAPGSDSGPPNGAVDWLTKLVDAGGKKADPKFLLKMALKGSSPVQVMAAQIAVLEGPAPVEAEDPPQTTENA